MNVTAQIFGAIAIIILFFSYLKVTKSKYLFLQVLCNIFFAIQFYCLNAWSAIGISIITIFKSIVFFHYENKKKDIPFLSFFIFELITITFGICIYTDFTSILPIIISCLYTYGTWQKNLHITYSIGTFTAILWFFYNFIIGAYVSTIGNVAEFTASLIGLYKLSKLKKNKQTAQ